MNHKALATIPIVALFALAAAGYFLYNQASANEPNVDYVGETTSRILTTVERQERGFEFYDQMIRNAANDAVREQIENNGFISENYVDDNCEKLINPVVGDTCQWNIAANTTALLEKELELRKTKNPYTQARLTTFEKPIVARQGDTLTVTVKTEETVKTGLKDAQSATLTPGGQTVFGNKTVSLSTLKNIDCQTSQSCTGLDKQCETTQKVFERLSQLDSLLQREGIQATITQSTRTWEMQQALYQRSKYCQRWKQQECSNPRSSQCGTRYDKQVGECFSTTCKACDPGQPNKPRRCPHMTGEAVDIVIPGMRDDQRSKEAMKALMCHFNMKHTVGGELWHYEAQECSPSMDLQPAVQELKP